MTGAVGEQRPRMATMGDDLIDREAALAILAPAANSRDGLWSRRREKIAAAIRALPSAPPSPPRQPGRRAMGDLLPCPWCGETKIEPVDKTRILGMWNIIHCCPVIGPFKIELSTREAVISIWNTRAIPSATQAGGWMPPEDRRVKPLVFSEFREGGCIGRPHPFQYFITQAHDGRFLCHWDETWHETLLAAQEHAQIDYQTAAFTPLPPAPEASAQREEARKG